jgi:hypothetical protein
MKPSNQRTDYAKELAMMNAAADAVIEDILRDAKPLLKPYQVTIDHTHTLEVFASDRKDAISYIKRAYQQRFFEKSYKKVTSAKSAARVQRRL